MRSGLCSTRGAVPHEGGPGVVSALGFSGCNGFQGFNMDFIEVTLHVKGPEVGIDLSCIFSTSMHTHTHLAG